MWSNSLALPGVARALAFHKQVDGGTDTWWGGLAGLTGRGVGVLHGVAQPHRAAQEAARRT
jgi:hypothetical protein